MYVVSSRYSPNKPLNLASAGIMSSSRIAICHTKWIAVNSLHRPPDEESSVMRSSRIAINISIKSQFGGIVKVLSLMSK